MSTGSTDGGRSSAGQAPKRSLFEDVSVRNGITTGIGAHLLGYVLTYVLLVFEAEGPLGDFLTPETNHLYEPVGWVFYGAHAVNVSVSNLNGAENVNYLLNIDYVYGLTIPAAVYYAVPIVSLVLAGYVTARRVGIPNRLTSGVLAGASVVFGYFVMAIVGAYMFEFLVAGQGAKPDVLMSALVIGLAYPIVAGGIGGALAASIPSVREVPAVERSRD